MNNTAKRVMAAILAVIMAASVIAVIAFSAFADASYPMMGNSARKAEQPKFSGYRILEMRNWSPETDPYAEYLRARIPLQDRIDPFKPTQANPELDSNAQIMLMQEDYGNAFIDGMPYNNTFLYNTLNFWQYTDYFSPWHGAATAKVPETLCWENDAWASGEFEFGILNIPNPAYTNAAHKNGAMSIACIYFDQNYRQGQTVDELLEKDENGRYIVADKLVEMAEYFGYDGYFFNCEESPYSYDVLREWLHQLESSGLYTQYYNTNSTFNSAKAQWLEYDLDGDGVKEKIQDSVFVNYGSFTNIDSQLQYAEENGYDTFEQIFFGVEANQNGFVGNHSSGYNLPLLYAEGSHNPRGSIALFCAGDMYHRAIDGMKLSSPSTSSDVNNMWMVAERERMYFSGLRQDPTSTGGMVIDRKDIGVTTTNEERAWVGVADFTSERSVVNGTVFNTNFNTGKGRSYWTDGNVTNDDDWTNITVQDILPSWQWWVETADEGAGKLGLDFDYGEKYYTETLDYKKVGAFNGGSSLVIAGDLETENLIRLYKTELDVTSASNMSVTYYKLSESDGSQLKLALIFKDAPETVEYIALEGTGAKTDEWQTVTADLSAYAGRKIATIALAVTPEEGETVKNYQINIGALTLTDGKNHTPEKPTGFKVSRAFATDDMAVEWDIGSFDTVDKYEIYAQLSNGKRIMVGTNYDSIHYIKSLENEKSVVELELVAIGKDGSRSEAAKTSYDYSEKVSNLTPLTERAETGNGWFTKRAGVIDLTWDEPETEYAAIEFTVTLDDSNDDTVIQKTVNAGETSVSIMLERGNGEKYQVAARTVFADGQKSEPIMVTGYMKDVWSQSYNPDKVQVDRKQIELWQPEGEDWWRLYAYFNGMQLNFQGTSQMRDHVLRAHNRMLTRISDNNGVLTVVLEDYCGNLSVPVSVLIGDIYEGDVNETNVPDAALRSALTRIAGGSKVSDLVNYKGAVDLSNLDITDLTGLEMMFGATSINLSGNTKITTVKNVFYGMNDLSEINISGMTGLQVFDISNSTVEKITCSNPEELKDIIDVNVSGCRLDLSSGTPERAFVDAMVAKTADVEGAKAVYDSQSPVLYPKYQKRVHFELGTGTVDPRDPEDLFVNGFETIRGTTAEKLAGADFLAKDYDAKAKLDVDMVLLDGDPDAVISLEKDAVYEVRYVKFSEANPYGGTEATTMVYVGELPPVDKTELEALVKEAEKIDSSKYTDETAAAFEEALLKAQAILANENATQEDVDDAYAALDAAMKALSEKPPVTTEPPTTEPADDTTDDPTQPPATEQPTDAPTDAPTGNLPPKTGDSSMLLFAVLMAVFAAALLGVSKLGKSND